MKTSKLLLTFLLISIFAGFSAIAQVPAKVGWWKFDDAADMLKADLGAALVLNGTQVSVPGPEAGNLATQIGPGSNLKLTHGIAPNGGGTMVNNYTIMLDISLPALGVWHAFYQTEVANTGDADLFCRAVESTLGVGATGYGTKALSQNIWYRMVISVENGASFKVYLNTELFLNGTAQAKDGRFALSDAFLLFADNSGDDNLINCSEVAVWDVALTEAEIISLGLAPGTKLVTGITVKSAADATTITTDNGTLQMSADILPVDATNLGITWSVTNGTGSASISADGLLTATEDGTVTAVATAKDVSKVSGSKEITISGQSLTKDDFNILKDGTFPTDGAIGGAWAFWSGNGGTASVISGVCKMVPAKAAESWQVQVNQTGNSVGWAVANDESYVFMFDAKADSARVFSIDFEDPNNGYKRFGLSSAADAVNGESQWDVALTTDMVTYSRDVTFNAVKANTKFLLNIMPSANIKPVYIDNIYLIKSTNVSKFGKVVTGITVKSAADATTIVKNLGTLQMSVDVLPADATLQGVTWNVTSGTGDATINASGLLTAKMDGTVTVSAVAKDGSGITGTKVITISNQWASHLVSANLIKDGSFSVTDSIWPAPKHASFWKGWSGNGGTASVVGGVCTMKPAAASDSWQLQVNQTGNDADNNGWVLENTVGYVFTFDAWADSARVFSIDFEDHSGNNYKRFGLSSDPDAAGGTSEWGVNLTTTKTTYTRVFTCTEAKANSLYKLNIMPGVSKKVTYIDNISLVKLSDLSSFGTLVTGITVSGASNATSITKDKGTLQMSAAVLPADATVKNIAWSVTNGTGEATIDSKGLLTAVLNGTVTVVATAADGSGISGTKDITISKQLLSVKEDLNLIKDGHFSVTDSIWPAPKHASVWKGWSGNGGAAAVEGGICVMKPAAASDNWQLQVNQVGNDADNNGWILENDTAYLFLFDAWADSARIFSIDFEDIQANNYKRFGLSSDADAAGGTSEWGVNLTTTKTTYSRVFTCTEAKANSLYKLNIMPGASKKVAYIDNIYLIKMNRVPSYGGIAVTGVTVKGAGNATTITTDLGTLQMSAALLPADATVKNIGWSVADGTGSATIDGTGKLKAVHNGTVTVTATSKDWAGVSGSLEITISGQTVSVSNTTIENIKVYPNPVLNELNVSFSTPNAKIAIYNSVGRKLVEVNAQGDKATFDVSSYARGLYFVKVNDGAVVKFVK